MIDNNEENQGGKTILIVEDDPLLTKMYQTKFESEGYNVLVASDGIVGLSMAKKGGMDVIVLDIMMPQLSGIDLLAKLRKTTKGKNIPVIVLTNLASGEEESRAKSLGVKEYLVKADQTPTALVEIINKYTG